MPRLQQFNIIHRIQFSFTFESCCFGIIVTLCLFFKTSFIYLGLYYSMCEGSKITYRIQIDDMLLPGFFSSRGNVPVNITVAADIINHLRIGCQRLIIYASNVVKVPGVFTHLQVLVKEPQP